MIARGLLAWVFVLGMVMVGCSDDGASGNDNENGNTNANGNANADCVPTDEVPDNGVDEDCDGWLATSRGFSLRAARPRVLTDPDTLAQALARMYGPEAREPYASWFTRIRDAEDTGEEVDLVNLALIYLATGDGAAAYTRKIDFFEREFLYLRPDVFVIFDRVQSVDPSYRKVWVVHTVDEPVVADTPAAPSGCCRRTASSTTA